MIPILSIALQAVILLLFDTGVTSKTPIYNFNCKDLDSEGLRLPGLQEHSLRQGLR